MYGPAGWNTGYYKEEKAITRQNGTRSNTKTNRLWTDKDEQATD